MRWGEAVNGIGCGRLSVAWSSAVRIVGFELVFIQSLPLALCNQAI